MTLFISTNPQLISHRDKENLTGKSSALNKNQIYCDIYNLRFVSVFVLFLCNIVLKMFAMFGFVCQTNLSMTGCFTEFKQK